MLVKNDAKIKQFICHLEYRYPLSCHFESRESEVRNLIMFRIKRFFKGRYGFDNLFASLFPLDKICYVDLSD